MINERCAKAYCSEDPSLIENYALAVADTTQTWVCHHILGEQYSKKYLKDNGLYESRPACELRFMTHAEHQILHHKGVPKSEAYKQAISDALKGVGAKKVLQYTKSGEFIKEWQSAMEAQIELGIAQSSICRCCKGKYKSAGGYVWRYALAEQQEKSKV